MITKLPFKYFSGFPVTRSKRIIQTPFKNRLVFYGAISIFLHVGYGNIFAFFIFALPAGDLYSMLATIAATELALESLDYPVELGKGVGAAQRVFSKSGVTA